MTKPREAGFYLRSEDDLTASILRSDKVDSGKKYHGSEHRKGALNNGANS